jgi:hypothetical protein
MTYNFDPDRWYQNERTAMEAVRREEKWNDHDYQTAVEALERRYDDMIRRLDGTYCIPP